MSDPGILHHRARGIHPGAFVQPTVPNTADVQDGVLWLDTSAGPPYQLKRWDAGGAAWRVVQMDATGYPLPGGHRLEEYDPFSGGSPSCTIVNPSFESAAAWEFTGTPAPGYGSAGICANGSALAAGMTAPAGTHMAYLISNGRLSQTVDVPTTGTWLLSIQTRVSRYDDPGILGVVLPIYLDIDGAQYPPSTHVMISATSMWFGSSALIPLSAGRHTLRLRGDADAFGAAGPGHLRLVILIDSVALVWSSGPAPTNRVRLVHAAAGPQLDVPFKEASGTPNAYLGQDPDSSLPVWCAAPVAAAQYLTQPRGPTADQSTCTTVKCGVASACTDHLNSLYSQWARWLGPLFLVLGTAAAPEVIEALGGMFLAEEALSAAPMIFGRLKPILVELPGIILGGLLPPLTSDQRTDVQKMLFCALSCEGGAVTPTVGAINAWHGALGAYSGWAVSSLQSELMQLLTEFTPLQDWLTAASSASPSTVCDAWTCP